MSYQRVCLESGVVKTVVEGEMDLVASLQSLNELAGFIKNKKLFEMVVHENGASITVGYDEAAEVIKRAQDLFNNLDAGAIAFVSNDDLLFGMCRQMQMRISNEKVQLAVFRNESTALQWLLELQKTT